MWRYTWAFFHLLWIREKRDFIVIHLCTVQKKEEQKWCFSGSRKKKNVACFLKSDTSSCYSPTNWMNTQTHPWCQKIILTSWREEDLFTVTKSVHITLSYFLYWLWKYGFVCFVSDRRDGGPKESGSEAAGGRHPKPGSEGDQGSAGDRGQWACEHHRTPSYPLIILWPSQWHPIVNIQNKRWTVAIRQQYFEISSQFFYLFLY